MTNLVIVAKTTDPLSEQTDVITPMKQQVEVKPFLLSYKVAALIDEGQASAADAIAKVHGKPHFLSTAQNIQGAQLRPT
jgi:hypothetical protein